MDSAYDSVLYVEDSDRTGGIRVEYSASNGTFATGDVVSISGVLHKGMICQNGQWVLENPNGTEPYIAASSVQYAGAASMPKPLAMPNKAVGGHAATGTVGITGGVGTFNTGMLVTVWGQVTYVGPDYIYLDDGCGLRDSNSLSGLIKVAPNAQNIPVPPDPALYPNDYQQFCTNYLYPRGIRVYFASSPEPGIGDCICVTGISSPATLQSGGPIIRLIRVRQGTDVVSPVSYKRCAKTIPALLEGGSQLDSYFLDIEKQRMQPVGSKVRIANVMVNGLTEKTSDGNNIPFIDGRQFDPAISKGALWPPLDIQAGAALSRYQCFTVVGTNQEFNTNNEYILADFLYLGHVNWKNSSTGMHADSFSRMSAAAKDAGGGPFNPWPAETADEIAASSDYQVMDHREDCIGWALAQLDGAVVDLRGENITGLSEDGHRLALRENVRARDGSAAPGAAGFRARARLGRLESD